jgi:GPH family glycoside/pentoside/hexuronide:cation symporter
MVISFYLIWVPPAGISGITLFWYYLAVIFAFDGFYTFVILNWTALFPEMYLTPGDRSTVNALRNALGIVGVIIGAALAPIIKDKFGWKGLGIIVGGAAAIMMFVSLLGSKENEKIHGEPLALGAAIKNTLVNKSFLTFALFNLFYETVLVMLQGVIPFYTQFVLLLTDMQKTLVLLIVFLMAVISQILWSKVVTKVGPRNTAIIGIIFFVICLLPFAFVKTLASSIPIFALIGIGLGALLIVGDIMVADICDEDFLKTGTRREGAYFGVSALIMRASVTISATTIAFVQSKTHYIAQLSDPRLQPQSALIGFRALMSIIPAVFLLISLISVLMYPLYGKRLEEIRLKIQAKKEM